MKRFILPFIIVFVSFSFLIAQSKRGNIGVFGNGVVLDFNTTPSVVFPLLEPGVIKFGTDEGSASISDSEGNLLFYTNGSVVWNREYEVMSNGSELHGYNFITSQTQTIIVPVPKDPFQYYIFTPGIQGDPIVYSLIDMRLDRGKGAVVFKNQLLYEKCTEKVTVIKHASNQSLWLITHEYGTNNFRTYEINENGIQPDYITSSVGLNHEENTELVSGYPVYGSNALGYLKPSHDGKYLACAIDGQIGTLELFKFDRATGVVSEPIELFRDPSKGSYGVEFSPDNSKLYLTCIDDPGLYQFDISSGDPITIKGSREVISSSKGQGALQLGPDGRIYVVPRISGNSLDRINDPNHSGSLCNYELNAVDLGSKSVWLGLPEFIYNTVDPEIIYDGFCPGFPTTFNLINIIDFESIEWNFGDPTSGVLNTSTSRTPSHIYSEHGEFRISVKVTFADNSVFDYSQRISLFPLPIVSLGEDTTTCDFNPLILVPQTDSSIELEYMWSDGSTNQFLDVKESGEYWVEVNDGICPGSDTIKVMIVPFPEIHLKDTTLCEGQHLSISLPDAFEYTWNDGSKSPVRILGSKGVYSVQGSNECGIREAAINLSIIPKLNVQLPKDSLLCARQTLKLDVTNEVAEYRWQDNSSNPFYSVSQDGEYWVEVFNRCEIKSDTINIGHVNLSDYFIPNVITPNGDGLNDFFVLDKRLIGGNLYILNRWGDEIYSATQYQNQWNADENPPGTYYYMINDECTLQKIKGSVHVMK